MSNYRMFYQIALFIVGIILAILGYGQYVNDIWGTIGIALIVCSGIRIITYIRMIKDPEYKRKVYVARKDERNIKIAEKAGSVTFRLVLFLTCLTELFLFAFEMIEVGISIGFVACVMLMIYWIMYMIYNKKY